MLVFLGMQQHPVLAEKLDDLRVSLEDVHSTKMLDLGNKAARRIDRIINIEAVLFADVKIVRAVARCSMNKAGAGFCRALAFKSNVKLGLGIGFAQRDVLAVHYQRCAFKPGMTSFEPVEL